mmetsp:Transcript_16453/g.24561  ORF Transcript_16453/g.24561 Transcript_16453/m.24561 type:complete len:132 (-) Transcript_16453:148-543(-)
MNSSKPIQLIDRSSRAAEQFVKVYYRVFDQSRAKLAALFSQNGSLCFDGHVFSSRKAIDKAVQKLPAMQHHIDAINAQPVQLSSSILITVNGSIAVGTNKKSFHTCFVLIREENGQYFILSSNVRTFPTHQ